MQEQGFTNYSYECWHFDYGNQMYVMMRDYLDGDETGAAWYGYVPAPTADAQAPSRAADLSRSWR
jgi:hypothetical protein